MHGCVCPSANQSINLGALTPASRHRFLAATVDHTQRMVRPDIHLGAVRDPALGALLGASSLLPILCSLVGNVELKVGTEAFDPGT